MTNKHIHIIFDDDNFQTDDEYVLFLRSLRKTLDPRLDKYTMYGETIDDLLNDDEDANHSGRYDRVV
jgi:hypothetical protein